MDYVSAISDAARAAGIDPAIALRVARRESNLQHYWPNGSVKVSSAGAIGIMQVEPATAPGVDLRDPQKNIKAGCGELARLKRVFGEWPLAIAAYEWGEGRVQNALKGLRAVPGEVQDYVAAVLGPGQLQLSASGKLALVVGPKAARMTTETAHTAVREHPGLVAVGILAAVLLAARVLR